MLLILYLIKIVYDYIVINKQANITISHNTLERTFSSLLCLAQSVSQVMLGVVYMYSICCTVIHSPLLMQNTVCSFLVLRPGGIAPPHLQRVLRPGRGSSRTHAHALRDSWGRSSHCSSHRGGKQQQQ